MSLFALITALLLEQVHPLSSQKSLFGMLSGYVGFFRQRFNAGQPNHGMSVWLLAVLPLLAGSVVVYQLLYRLSPVFAWAFDVMVLYLTMGFRQSSHFFTDIHTALRDDKLDEARTQLSIWRGITADEMNAEEVARLTIEQALIASHRQVFGVIVWFVIFSTVGLGGPAGALLYRLGEFLCWHLEEEDASGREDRVVTEWGRGELGDFARKAFNIMDWLPVRMTAMTFAIVGNFEDTIHCWRTQAASWPDRETGILLSSGAGALGVRLGMPIRQGGILLDRPELGTGDDADPGFMQSTVGLVWRSVAFWLILLLILTLSNLLGW